MMDFLRGNAKAVAGAVTTLIVLLLRPFVPAVADPMFQPALEIIVGALIVASTVWLVPNKPPTGMDDRKAPPPIAGLLLATVLLPVVLGACSTVSPRQQFVNSCAAIGEAMAQVVVIRRDGKVDDATYVVIDDAYDAAVETCATLPPTDGAAQIAFLKVNEFLSRASGATGVNYGSY